MSWKFKLCTAVFDKRVQVLEHYRLHHANVSSISPLPCPYDDCICTFQSINALKIYLTQLHTQTAVHSANHMECVSSICSVCGLKQLLSDKTLLSRLRTHLKQHEMVDCAFRNCQHSSNVYSFFNAHKNRNHPDGVVSDFKDKIILTGTDSSSMQSQVESNEPCSFQYSFELETTDYNPLESRYDTDELQAQWRNNLASLFLKMHSVLHVSEMAKT